MQKSSPNVLAEKALSGDIRAAHELIERAEAFDRLRAKNSNRMRRRARCQNGSQMKKHKDTNRRGLH
jgi:hypothetical protein